MLPVELEVTSKVSIDRALASLPTGWQNIDVLINNAGLALGLEPAHQAHLDDWDTMIDTNVKGLLYVTRQIAPMMREQCAGHIINIGSTAGKIVYKNGNVYCASKAAVAALTKGMRLDLLPQRAPKVWDDLMHDAAYQVALERLAQV